MKRNAVKKSTGNDIINAIKKSAGNKTAIRYRDQEHPDVRINDILSTNNALTGFIIIDDADVMTGNDDT